MARREQWVVPELPEVETVRRSLLERLPGRVVRRVRLLRRDVLTLPGDPPGGWSRRGADAADREPQRHRGEQLLSGQKLVDVRRHGKQLAIVADSGRCVLVHLGMTGQLLHEPDPRRGARLDHVHARWALDDGSELLFRDPRRFGGLWSLDEAQLGRRWEELGVDGLALAADDLRSAVSGARRAIKAVLLDQRRVAGIGNIYADEALFRAGIAPTAIAASLDRQSVERLTDALRQTLGEAVEARGSTLRDYRDADGATGGFQLRHRVYGRGGLECVACGSTLSTGTVAQRTTVWCPSCQKTE